MLLYLLELAPHERSIARQCVRQRQPLPDRIANAPQLRLGLALYLDAFFELDSERNHGMGLQRIPWTSIKGYAMAFDFDDEQTENLFCYVRKMDAANLERLEGAKK